MAGDRGPSDFEIQHISAIRKIGTAEARLIAEQQQQERAAAYAQIQLMNLNGAPRSEEPKPLGDTLAELGIGQPSMGELLNGRPRTSQNGGESNSQGFVGSGVVAFVDTNGRSLGLDSPVPVPKSVERPEGMAYPTEKPPVVRPVDMACPQGLLVVDIDLDNPNVGEPIPGF